MGVWIGGAVWGVRGSVDKEWQSTLTQWRRTTVRLPGGYYGGGRVIGKLPRLADKKIKHRVKLDSLQTAGISLQPHQ